jgi:hypothetical protein
MPLLLGCRREIVTVMSLHFKVLPQLNCHLDYDIPLNIFTLHPGWVQQAILSALPKGAT